MSTGCTREIILLQIYRSKRKRGDGRQKKRTQEKVDCKFFTILHSKNIDGPVLRLIPFYNIRLGAMSNGWIAILPNSKITEII